MVDRTPYRQQKTGQQQNTMTRKEGEIMVDRTPVVCCLSGVMSTIIFPFFPGHRVLVLHSLLLSIWCSVHHYFPFFPGHRVLVKRLCNTKTR
jgi:hypothetical protein